MIINHSYRYKSDNITANLDWLSFESQRGLHKECMEKKSTKFENVLGAKQTNTDIC